jgi:hypothetical protein
MHIHLRKSVVLLATVMLAMSVAILMSPAASATPVSTCSGTPDSPGVLATTNGSAQVSGFCTVSGGPTVINGSLTLLPGSGLLAAFAHSPLLVNGSVYVRSGATLILGCDPQEFSCMDDPNAIGSSTVNGRLVADHPLGVIEHRSTINGNVVQTGGGGGVSCDPSGIFNAFGSPVFSTYELGSINGNLTITGVASCWLGVEDMRINGNVTITNNQLADLDAIEVTAGHFNGNLSCTGNSAVWDNNEGPTGLFPRIPNPNVVTGTRSGQCVLASPTTSTGSPGPGPF